MAPDQAAGLRRRHAGTLRCCVQGVFESQDASARLADTLGRLGGAVLLIDASGRPRRDGNAVSLFDWKRQLARGQLHLVSRAFGDAWCAPGIGLDAAGLAEATMAYDCVVFDHGPNPGAPAWWPDAARALVVEVSARPASRQRAFQLIKTLASSGERIAIGLWGDAASCEQVREACRCFLGAAHADAVCIVSDTDDAFVTHAIRMAGEETGRRARE